MQLKLTYSLDISMHIDQKIDLNIMNSQGFPFLVDCNLIKADSPMYRICQACIAKNPLLNQDSNQTRKIGITFGTQPIVYFSLKVHKIEHFLSPIFIFTCHLIVTSHGRVTAF